jgi:hypothetical protein
VLRRHSPLLAVESQDRVAALHLATTSEASPNRQQAAELLQRHRTILEDYRELTTNHDRSRARNDRDIGYGVDR